MKPEYARWIAENVPQDPRGGCTHYAKEMARAFPELTAQAGVFIDAEGHRSEHWWCKTEANEVVDPTLAQFFHHPTPYTYEEYNGPQPTGKCPNCGDYIWDGGQVCSDRCGMAYEAYLMNSSKRYGG